MGSLIIFTDAGAPVDPGAADISAHGARCNADLGIVANALHLAGISFGINIENGDGGRVAQYIPSEPDGSGHTEAIPQVPVHPGIDASHVTRHDVLRPGGTV